MLGFTTRPNDGDVYVKIFISKQIRKHLACSALAIQNNSLTCYVTLPISWDLHTPRIAHDRCIYLLWATFIDNGIWCMYIYIYIYTYNGSVIQCWRSCTPSRSIGLYFWGVRGSWAECHFLFSLVYRLCLVLWYKSNTRMLVTFGICFKQHFDTRYLVFYNPSPPKLFFCPWTFFENIGFNTVLMDPFISHLATQLGYSAGEFQALQLIVLAAFGAVD